jgi:hypothetical protein
MDKYRVDSPYWTSPPLKGFSVVTALRESIGDSTRCRHNTS